MRIVIDLQGAQTGSRFRGIGRNAISLTKALVRRADPADEFFIVLNGLFGESIEPIRAAFEGLVPQENIRVWTTPGPIENFVTHPANMREIGEIMREHYLRALEPDVVLINSVFEGQSDDAVVSIKKHAPEVPVACVFHDITPLIMPDQNARANPLFRRWYRQRIASLKRADLLLAVSESSRHEAITRLDFKPDEVVNIFSGCDEKFRNLGYDEAGRAAVRRQFGIRKPYILYAGGGVEANKNLKSLIKALDTLPHDLRDSCEFVCVGKRNPGEAEEIRSFAVDPVTREMISVIGYVSEDGLIDLYNCCELFVFPSLREGFGLPAVEAMACGAPTIVSDRTSLPEVVANPDALFDPEDPSSIGAKIIEVFRNETFRQELREKGLVRAATLTWDVSADKALAVLRTIAKHPVRDEARRTRLMTSGVFKPNRISILAQKLDHHGDFFLGLPAFAKLRARYPDARIDALVGSWNRAAAEASGLFDNVYTLDYFTSRSSERPSVDGHILRNLGAINFYDYAIDFRRHSDTRFILFNINSQEYYGYKVGRSEIDDLLSASLDIHPEHAGERDYFDDTHTSEQMLRIVDLLPFDVNDYLKLPDLGRRVPVRPGAVAIFPRVGVDSRQWETSRFVDLVTRFLGAPEVTEINIFAGNINELIPFNFPQHEKIKLQCGLEFSELFTSLSGNQVCVGNNSFGVHLASYIGCETIGIYSGHELPEQWGPGFNDARVIAVDAACGPCHLPDRQSCKFNVFCLDDISVEIVARTVIASLRGEAFMPERSDIVASNPATAVKPLIDSINKGKSRGRITELRPEQRIAVAASISQNFPERTRLGRNLFVDLSNFVTNAPNMKSANGRKFAQATNLIDQMRRVVAPRYNLVEIASGIHDHEFYIASLASPSEIFTAGRSERIVHPLPGDIYLGIDAYLYRNKAQWDALYTWRTLGARIAFMVPSETLAKACLQDSDEDERSIRARTFLYQAAAYDLLISERGQDFEPLYRWALENRPQRVRALQIGRAGLIEAIGDLDAEGNGLLGHRDEAEAFLNLLVSGVSARSV